MSAARCLREGLVETPGNRYFAAAASFLRSAHRFFMASAMRLRPSALILRLRGAALAAVLAFLLPLGRPRPLTFTVVPESSSRAC